MRNAAEAVAGARPCTQKSSENQESRRTENDKTLIAEALTIEASQPTNNGSRMVNYNRRCKAARCKRTPQCTSKALFLRTKIRRIDTFNDEANARPTTRLTNVAAKPETLAHSTVNIANCVAAPGARAT